MELFTIHGIEKELIFDVNIQEDLIIMGDSQRIQQVFYNVLDNAIKYSKQKGMIIIALTAINDSIKFKVTNYGMLIEQADLERIGERFFRTDKARNRTTGGTGLGLSIVKEIIRLHDGTFNIWSHSTEGTTVLVQLPGLKDEV